MKYPALYNAALHCIANGIQIPVEVLELCMDVKTLSTYDNALTRLVAIRIQQLRSPFPPIGTFGEDLFKEIETGLTEAWRAGMRENGADEMLPEWQDILDGIIADERSHIPDFSQYLADMAPEAESIGAAMLTAQSRLSLWVNRYEDVRNQAILASAEEKTKLEWVYGDTEHCETCAQLNGMVAYAREWDEAGIKPQSPPNDLLTCGGWNCQCQLVSTDKRRSRDVLSRLLDIAAAGGL